MQVAKLTLLLVSLFHFCAASSRQANYQEIVEQLQLPPGFSISLYSDNVPNARSLALGDNNVVYVATGVAGTVYALQDNDHDGIAETRHTIASGLFMPNGVAYKDGSLYVAEISRIIRFNDIGRRLADPPSPVVVYDSFPANLHHGWKYLRFGPDNKLYTAVGAPCNVCNPEQPVYSSLVRLDQDGGNFEILARGIRNTVGFDWQPETDVLFFNDNGRDYLGDDLPPEELDRWSVKGEHFGFPFCHGGNVPDPQFGNERKCSEFTPPAWKYKAHVAPLGMRFYRGDQFPERYKNQLFVAHHGSWNRSKPDGYRIALINFNKDKPVSEEPFISGWLTKDDDVLGRPVDLLTLPDGSLLISDDHLGVVYRVIYKGK